MHIHGSTTARDTAIPLGSSELVEGLMLVRASTLKMIRLQLALERHDRRGVLEMMDDLVGLDRRLQACLEAASAAGDHLMFRRELDVERAALNEERLTLATEVLRRRTSAGNQAAGPIEVDSDWQAMPDVPLEAQESHRGHLLWLVIMLIAASVVAAAAYFLSAPDAPTWLANVAGALK